MKKFTIVTSLIFLLAMSLSSETWIFDTRFDDGSRIRCAAMRDEPCPMCTGDKVSVTVNGLYPAKHTFDADCKILKQPPFVINEWSFQMRDASGTVKIVPDIDGDVRVFIMVNGTTISANGRKQLSTGRFDSMLVLDDQDCEIVADHGELGYDMICKPADEE